MIDHEDVHNTASRFELQAELLLYCREDRHVLRPLQLEIKPRITEAAGVEQPMWFGAVKIGKSYVSYPLMPLYMNAALANRISPQLKTRMHGKSCFNFTTTPDEALLADLEKLTEAAVDYWARQGFL